MKFLLGSISDLVAFLYDNFDGLAKVSFSGTVVNARERFLKIFSFSYINFSYLIAILYPGYLA